MTDQQRSQPQRMTLDSIRPYIRGRQISIYLVGREKPMTRLTVCAVFPLVIVARWNSSTHLIPWHNISAIRFSPDCDPCRDINHPLHDMVLSMGRSCSASVE